MKKDKGLDLIGILKGRPKFAEQLKDIPLDQISQIFLFFDYDGHAPSATDDKLKEQLKFFNDETDNGKLYISYPMAEAVQHLKSAEPFQQTTVKAKENIDYKRIAKSNCDSRFENLNGLSKDTWKIIISEHCKKLHYLMTENFSLPEDIVEQIEVFEKQLEKHISTNNEVAVLSAFPVFLLDYYGAKKLPSFID